MDPQLRAHLHFDDADLEANRQGQLSPAQRTRLMASARVLLYVCPVLGVVMGSGAFLFVTAGFWAQCLTAASIVLVFTALGAAFFLRQKQGVDRGHVKTLVGTVQFRRVRHGLVITVGESDRAYPMPVPVTYFDGAMIYRVYVLDGTDEVVSIERDG